MHHSAIFSAWYHLIITHFHLYTLLQKHIFTHIIKICFPSHSPILWHILTYTSHYYGMFSPPTLWHIVPHTLHHNIFTQIPQHNDSFTHISPHWPDSGWSSQCIWHFIHLSSSIVSDDSKTSFTASSFHQVFGCFLIPIL